MAEPLSPCKNCEKRQVGCHSKCEDFIKFRRALGSYKKAIRDSLHKKNIYAKYQLDKNERAEYEIRNKRQ